MASLPSSIVVCVLILVAFVLGDHAVQAQTNQNKTCTKESPNLETIYYKLKVTLNAAHPDVVNRCDENQLFRVAEVINEALTNLDIPEEHAYNIESHSSHLCREQDYNTGNRRLSWSVSSEYLVYYIFRGGGRCYYCATDNADYRKLSIGSDQSGILHSTADEILNDVGVPAFSSGLRGVVPVEQQRGLDKGADRIELYQPFSEELWTKDDADFDPKDPTPFAVFDDNHTDSDENDNMHNGSTADGRNLQDDEMCGCHHVEFDRDGKNREIWGTPYIPTDEWRTRHGFDVYVGHRVENGEHFGYAPGRRARIYDTDEKAATENPDFNYNLGSPNFHCGGLGRGAGGRPLLSNGEPNPGANCVPQGKVLIVQEAKKINADAADLGGDILFHFKMEPVTLKAIGLLDVESSTRAEIKVWQLNGNGGHVISRFHPKGYGGNAVETMNFDLKDVLKVRVRFQDTAAAVTMISFCYDKDCKPTKEEPPADAIEAFNREVRPHIESSAIFHITNAIMAESMGKDGADFCLGPTETSVDVDMEVTMSPQEACQYS